MISLYQFLTEKKGYTDFDAEETILRYDIEIEIPDEIKKDIEEYWNGGNKE